MTAADAAYIFPFSETPTEESEVECRQCGKWSTVGGYLETRTHCERCPDGHITLTCRWCGHGHDHVYVPTMRVRK